MHSLYTFSMIFSKADWRRLSPSWISAIIAISCASSVRNTPHDGCTLALVVTLAASSGKRNASVCCPSVRPSVPCAWLGSQVVRATDLRLNGRQFDPRTSHYRSVCTGMGDRHRVGIPPRCVTSHSGQLSFSPSAGREMSTGQSAVMLCSYE